MVRNCNTLPTDGSSALDSQEKARQRANIIQFPCSYPSYRQVVNLHYDYTDVKLRRAAHTRPSRKFFDRLTDASEMLYSLRYESLNGTAIENVGTRQIVIFCISVFALGALSLILEVLL